MRGVVGHGEGQRLLPVARCVRDPDPRRRPHRLNRARRRRSPAGRETGVPSRQPRPAPRLGPRRQSPQTPVPGRKSTLGSSASRATISRRSSQLGRFQPKGASPQMSSDSKSRTIRARPSPPAGIDDAHDPQRRRVRRQPLPEARRAPAACARGLQEGGGAQVGAPAAAARSRAGRGRRRVTAKPARAEGGRRGQPGDAAAGDQDVVVAVHGAPARPRGGATGKSCQHQPRQEVRQVVGMVVDVVLAPPPPGPRGPSASPSRAARRGCGDRPRTWRPARGAARRGRRPPRRPRAPASGGTPHAPRRRPRRTAPDSPRAASTRSA